MTLAIEGIDVFFKVEDHIPARVWMPPPRIGGWVYLTAHVGLQKRPFGCFYCSHDGLKGKVVRILRFELTALLRKFPAQTV